MINAIIPGSTILLAASMVDVASGLAYAAELTRLERMLGRPA